MDAIIAYIRNSENSYFIFVPYAHEITCFNLHIIIISIIIL